MQQSPPAPNRGSTDDAHRIEPQLTTPTECEAQLTAAITENEAQLTTRTECEAQLTAPITENEAQLKSSPIQLTTRTGKTHTRTRTGTSSTIPHTTIGTQLTYTPIESTAILYIYQRPIAKDTIQYHGGMEDGTMVRLDVLEFKLYIEYSHPYNI